MQMHCQFSRFIKVLSLFNFLSIFLFLYIIFKVASTNSYEISIYNEYPWFFWWIIIFSLVVGRLILILQVIFQKDYSSYWIWGFLSILITSATLLFLPLIRGYAIYGTGDVLTHIGLMRTILITGHLGSNVYPMDHLIGVVLFFVSGISLENITLFIPQIFSLLSIIFFVLVCKEIFVNKSQALIGIAFTSLLISSNAVVSFSPNGQAMSLVPLALYLFLHRQNIKNITEYRILNVIIIFLIVFYHPLVVIMLILILLGVDISFHIYSNLNQHVKLRLNNSVILIVFALIAFSSWQSYASIIFHSFKQIYEWLFTETVHSEFLTYSQAASTSNFPLFQLINIFIYSYGMILFLSILSFLSLFYLLRAFSKQKDGIGIDYIFPAIGFIIFATLSFLSMIVATGFGFVRIYNFTIIFSLILISSSVYIFAIGNKHRKYVVTFAILVIFIILVYLSTFTLISSPYTRALGQHVTQGELNGMKWFLNSRDENKSILEFTLSQKRFYDEIFGADSLRKNINYGDLATIPDHFGYDKNNTSFSRSNDSRYIILTNSDRLIYPTFYPQNKELWRFTDRDFSQFAEDKTLMKIYADSEIEVHLSNNPANMR